MLNKEVPENIAGTFFSRDTGNIFSFYKDNQIKTYGITKACPKINLFKFLRLVIELRVY